MTLDPITVLAIAGMAIATYLTRIAGLALVSRLSLNERARTALDAVPPAVLMAVIAPSALATGPAETLAAIVTAVVAIRAPLLITFLVGIASVVILRAVLGG